MILSFSTKDKNGKPTNFVEKIWLGLEQISPIYKQYSKEWFKLYFNKFGRYWDVDTRLAPKKHTIREDAHNRWHAGVLIHFTVFPRSSKMFLFAPVIPCKSVQKIVILHIPHEFVKDNKPGEKYVIAEIDGRILEQEEVETLSKNDGFDSVDDFFNWFKDDFTGKIIHWTELRY